MTATKTALWIVERQMMKETEENVRMHLVFVPLTSYANIVEDNAVRVDWDHVVPREKLDYIMGNPPFIVPKVSSERRRYIPIGYMEPNIFSNDLVFIMPSSTMYHFGILTSNVHIAQIRAVCGQRKSGYTYSKDVVYNNFPWPTPTDAQKAKIEQTAQAILDARALYPYSSLADLYDEVTMPPELRKAHQQNDKSVIQAYEFWGKHNTET